MTDATRREQLDAGEITVRSRDPRYVAAMAYVQATLDGALTTAGRGG